ncbi:HTTM domain-containing protein [Halobacteriales archaeon QS_4_70_19]|nr:MAG: HTTM domain-containing protein [Halobacteriales archaeon QS_4_70_19]
MAALRVALGLLLLVDLLLRSRALVAHYTDRGVLPRPALREVYGPLADISLHALSGGVALQVALFALAGLAALALTAGYRTRLAAVVSWLLLVSLHARNPLVLNAGDSVLRRLLFWGLFLPLGGTWSVDAFTGERDTSDRNGTVVGVATAALLVQVVLVYALNAVIKLRGEAWPSGTAVRYVLGIDHLTVLLGDALAGYPALLEPLARGWLVLLVLSPLLLVLTGRPRALLAAAFAAGHLGMALTLRLGPFPFVSIAALLPFLPPRMWDMAGRRLRGVVSAARRGRIERALRRVTVPLPRESTLSDRLRTVDRRVAPVVVAALLVAVLLWNAVSIGVAPAPAEVRDASEEYRWDMFAPEPRRTDGWYVAPATLPSGERVDAWNGGSVSWGPPPDTATTFPSHRWLVYLLDLRRPGGAPLRDDFGAYLCDRWAARHDSRPTDVSVVYVERPVVLDGPTETRRVDLGTYRCPAE